MNHSVIGIVPTFNHEKWFLEALDSLVNQTHKVQAIVVVDDGSTDNTWSILTSKIDKQVSSPINGDEPKELIEGLYKGTPCLAVRFSKNYGPSMARNYAIRSIMKPDQENILAFLDSDDKYHPNKVEESLKYFDNPFVGVVYSDYYTFNQKGKYHQYKEPYNKLRLLQGESISNMDSLIRDKCFTDCGLFDDKLVVCEDLDLWLRISNKYLLCHLPKPLIDIRIGEHSSSNTRNKEVWEKSYRYAMEKNLKQSV